MDTGPNRGEGGSNENWFRKQNKLSDQQIQNFAKTKIIIRILFTSSPKDEWWALIHTYFEERSKEEKTSSRKDFSQFCRSVVPQIPEYGITELRV